jgi:hypothetical protein
MEQRDLRSVADLVKHGFTGKEAANGDAIDATGKQVALPAPTL